MLRPAYVGRALLAALQASEGRRKQRKRDQTPDIIGLSIKRALLERIAAEDPDPEAFEDWLLRYALEHEAGEASGGIWAMARAVLDEWRLAHAMDDFATWLQSGAPSADAQASGDAPGGADMHAHALERAPIARYAMRVIDGAGLPGALSPHRYRSRALMHRRRPLGHARRVR